MEVPQQGPKEVVVDAYAEHVRQLHAREDVEKIGTLRLPQSHLMALARVITDAMDDLESPLTPEQQQVWLSIVRTIARAVREAK